MTIEQAVDEARRMQQAADAGWPEGYNAARVTLRASKLVRLFDEAATTPEQARELVAQLEPAPEVAW